MPAAQRLPSLTDAVWYAPDEVAAAARAKLPAVPRRDVRPGTEVRFRFDPPATVESTNAVGKWHHTRLAPWRRTWRTGAYTAALEQRAVLEQVAGCRVQVSVALPVSGNQRRDPANYRATTKPVIDGITDAGLIWPDDNAVWVTETEPRLWHGEHVVVRLVVLDPDEQLWDPAS